jgi:hypothetical protein
MADARAGLQGVTSLGLIELPNVADVRRKKRR